MLKRVIKRDKSIEEYTPSKLNKWAQWSAGYNDRIDWGSVVLDAMSRCNEIETSQQLQKYLIDSCNEREDWSHRKMAGRLYASLRRKELYNNVIPTVQELNNTLFADDLMVYLNYDTNDYAEIENIIQHDRDFDLAHFQLHQIRKKYSIQSRTTGKEYETAQFVFMRMALALAEEEPKETRMKHVRSYYDHFSLQRINAPSPNYINLGTKNRGYASCCLYIADDCESSLAIGDHIAYRMTAMSAGIGGMINTRSIGDPIRAGLIEHQGKLPYYQSLAKATKANIQAGRGGACTTYYSAFDPEAEVITMLQNQRSPEKKKNRDIHFAFTANRFISKKAAAKKQKDRMVFTFTSWSAPDLWKKMYSSDMEGFEELYYKYEADETFIKNYVDARKIILTALVQGFEVGTVYLFFCDEANRHTPFKETIHTSNLCLEIAEPTKPYFDMRDLYSTEDHGRGEVALCSIAGIVTPNISSDEIYADACYYALKMIDKCIEISKYVLPHVGFTAKNRMNAGVGVVGFAYQMAKKNLKYDTVEGRNEIHRAAETHAYFMIKASLRIAKERGVAPWINKTKWPEGWLPIDTYKKTIDSLVTVGLERDWESLRTEIIAAGGIGHSCLIAHMPTESSSKAAGVPNGWYPIRELAMKKSDGSNVVDWCPPESDTLADNYQTAYTIETSDMIKVYGIIQKFTDQGISADLYKDRTKIISLSTTELLNNYLDMVRYGMKSRYYQNSLVSKQENNNDPTLGIQLIDDLPQPEDERGCASGACSL